MSSKIIKPNIFYATVLQFFQLLIYIGIGVGCYKLMVYFLDFEIIPYIIDTLKNLEFVSLKMMIEFIEDNVTTWFIALMTSIILLFINLVNKKVEILDNSIISKEGFIKINSKEFMFDDIKRYELEKDFGFMNSGTIDIMTIYGDKITLEYVVNLKKAKSFLDEIIKKNNERKNYRGVNNASGLKTP